MIKQVKTRTQWDKNAQNFGWWAHGKFEFFDNIFILIGTSEQRPESSPIAYIFKKGTTLWCLIKVHGRPIIFEKKFL